MEPLTVFESMYKNYTYKITKVNQHAFVVNIDDEVKGTYKAFTTAMFHLFGLVINRYSQGDLDY